MDIRGLGYVRLQSTVVDEWDDFAVGCLGLMPVDGPEGSRRYRSDELAARVVVVPGEADRLAASGWEVAGVHALREAADALTAAGVDVEWGSEDACLDRNVEAFVAFDDPAGNRLELFHSPLVADDPVALRGVSGFVTGDQGLGHVVLPAGDLAETFEFYTRVLGFVHRDSMLVSPPGTTPYRMRFLACNPRHHSVALTEAESPTGLRHLMLHARTITDVGRAYDRCRAGGATLKTTLGQHSNDLMVSFYVYSPGGFEVELATGGEPLDLRTWRARELGAFRLWGYEPLA